VCACVCMCMCECVMCMFGMHGASTHVAVSGKAIGALHTHTIHT